MANERPMDEPSPTIVGPQPAQPDGGRRLKAPCGLEHLLALACLNVDWLGKVLADPLRAADEAGLKLSEQERTVVQSVPTQALKAMIDSFSRRAPVKPDMARTSSWAAAAALLASSLTGCDKIDSMLGVASMGIREDAPTERESQAKPEPKKPVEPQVGPVTKGILADEPPAKRRQTQDEKKGSVPEFDPNSIPAPGGRPKQ